jgi:hypothetical protein
MVEHHQQYSYGAEPFDVGTKAAVTRGSPCLIDGWREFPLSK